MELRPVGPEAFHRVRNSAAPLHAVSADIVERELSGSTPGDAWRAAVGDDDEAVGVAWHTDVGQHLSVGVAVAPAHRGRGFGRFLADALAKRLTKIGAAGAALVPVVDHHDERSVRFAEARGAAHFPPVESGSYFLDVRRYIPATERVSGCGFAVVASSDLHQPKFRAQLLQVLRIADEGIPSGAGVDDEWVITNELLRLLTGGCTIVATRNGRVVGATLASRAYALDQIYSDYTLVRPDERGRGVGTELKRAQLDWALDNNIQRIVTDVGAHAAPMHAILRKLGFQTWRREGMTLPVPGPASAASTQ